MVVRIATGLQIQQVTTFVIYVGFFTLGVFATLGFGALVLFGGALRSWSG